MERMSRMRSIHFYPLLRIEGIENGTDDVCVLARAFNETVFLSDSSVSRVWSSFRDRLFFFSTRCYPFFKIEKITEWNLNGDFVFRI